MEPKTKATTCLCLRDGLQFANPSIVALAAYRIYGHRIVVADKDTDRGVVWGSRKGVVDKYLAQVDADMIINNVLEEVRAPLSHVQTDLMISTGYTHSLYNHVYYIPYMRG